MRDCVRILQIWSQMMRGCQETFTLLWAHFLLEFPVQSDKQNTRRVVGETESVVQDRYHK